MNHYEILGVEKTATPAVIRKAYKRMAKKHHPDRAPEGQREQAHKEMVLVNKAYDTLMDPAKREHYDLTGEDKPVTPIDVEAKNTLLTTFTQLFNDSRRARFNIPKRATAVATEAGAKISYDRSEALKFIEEIRARREEVTVAEGEENLWLQLLDSQIGEFQAKVAAADHKLAVTKRVLEMLAAYRSEVQGAPSMERQTFAGLEQWARNQRPRGF